MCVRTAAYRVYDMTAALMRGEAGEAFRLARQLQKDGEEPLFLLALLLFNSDPEVIRYGRMFILYLSPFYVPFCVSQIYAGALRGAGASSYPMIICIFSFVLFRQAYLFIGTRLITSPIFVGLSYPAGWLMSSTLMYIAYKKGNWQKRITVPAASE